jgi:hypothetical protein
MLLLLLTFLDLNVFDICLPCKDEYVCLHEMILFASDNDDLCVVEVEVNLRPTVSRPVCLGVRRPSGTCDQFFFLLEISFRQLRVCYFVAPSLTRGQVCNLLYNCFWALPEQSLMGRSPAELTALFYCLILRLPQPGGPGSRIYIPQEQGGPVIPPGTGFPFYRLLRLAFMCCGMMYINILRCNLMRCYQS